MLIQARNKTWNNKLLKCKTKEERNKLMLRSGTESCRQMIDMKTFEEFWVPTIGQFAIRGVNKADEFEYKTMDEAAEKGMELRKQVEQE